jgi:TolA-binding protein
MKKSWRGARLGLALALLAAPALRAQEPEPPSADVDVEDSVLDTEEAIREAEEAAREAEEAIREAEADAREAEASAREAAEEVRVASLQEQQDREQEQREREEERKAREVERKEREEERRRERLERAEERYERGTEALDEGRWDRALAAFDEVCRSEGPRCDGALYWKAYAQGRLGRRAEAQATLAELRKSHPQSRWVSEARALDQELQQASGKPRSTVQWLRHWPLP